MADEHISPGFLTPSAAAYLKRAALETEQNRQKMAEMMRPPDVKDFPAVITSGSGGYHAWTEQAFDATGARYTRPGGRTGTAAVNPACLPDRSAIASAFLPHAVWLRRTIWDATYGVIYEIVSDSVRGITVTDGTGSVTDVTTLTLAPDAAWTITGSTPNATATIGPISFTNGATPLQVLPNGTITLNPADAWSLGVSNIDLVQASGTNNGYVDLAEQWLGTSRKGIIGSNVGADADQWTLLLAGGVTGNGTAEWVSRILYCPSAAYASSSGIPVTPLLAPYTGIRARYDAGVNTYYYYVLAGLNAVEVLTYGYDARTVLNNGYEDTKLRLHLRASNALIRIGSTDGGSATLNGMTFLGGIYTSGTISSLTVAQGGTGAASFTAGQLLAGNGTSALDSATGTRIVSENLELKLGTDSWVAFTEGSF